MELQTAKGVRDIPPEEKILKNKVVDSLVRIFELYGFMPLETPLLERYETLAAKGGAGTESDALKETFTLNDQGNRRLGLRFELTTSLARFVAMNPNLKMPFKRYELGPVFRDGPIKLGRYREFWQCDVDTIGSSSMLSEAEFLGVATAFFQYWKIPAVIKINNRKLLNGLLEQAGITKKSEALIAIDKLDKIGVAGVSAELIDRGYSPEQTEKLFTYIKEGITLSSLRGIVYNEEGKQGLLELEEVFSYAKAMGVDNLSFDISLARGQAYYTGIVFEVYAQGGEVKSSLAGGGRYDDMIGKFIGGGRQIPAVGLSFGLAPIMDVLRLRGDILGKSSAQVYVVPINTPLESLQVVQQLRFAGIKADFSQSKKGVSKNLEYASALGIPYVILIGGDEVAQKKVLLRDMNDGTEQLLSVKDVIGKLKK